MESPAGAELAGVPLPHVLILHGFKGFMHWGFFPELSRRLGVPVVPIVTPMRFLSAAVFSGQIDRLRP